LHLCRKKGISQKQFENQIILKPKLNNEFVKYIKFTLNTEKNLPTN